MRWFFLCQLMPPVLCLGELPGMNLYVPLYVYLNVYLDVCLFCNSRAGGGGGGFRGSGQQVPAGMYTLSISISVVVYPAPYIDVFGADSISEAATSKSMSACTPDFDRYQRDSVICHSEIYIANLPR